MSDLKDRITELADIMDEFGLSNAKLSDENWSIAFSRAMPTSATIAFPAPTGEASVPLPPTTPRKKSARAAVSPHLSGIPITSPMTGIYYSSPSPGSPPFVKVGDNVTAGQVVGLIEAMKVFNEITAGTSGQVASILVESGQLVNPGDTLLTIA